MAPFDPWDQAQLTHLINRQITVGRENTPSLADQIAPKRSVQARRVKFKVASVDAFGVGQLRAPDADPQLTRTQINREERLVDLALPDEMERISEDVQQKLASSDQNIRDAGGADLTTRGAVLAERSRRAVERMRWDAFLTGKVRTDYTDSASVIDFGLVGTHVVTASTLWSDTGNADPVSDLRTWQRVLANDVGFYGLKIHMNTNTWEYVYNNKKLREYLVPNNSRSLLIPNKGDFTSLLYEGSEVVVYDGGYRAVGSDRNTDGTPKGELGRGWSSMTPWLPDGKVLITTPYSIDGEQIADTPEGMVAVASGYNTVDWRQGAQAEQILHPISKNLFLRYGNAAIPRVLIPEAFFVATVA